jgi:hydroxyacylglutathione hydrolase
MSADTVLTIIDFVDEGLGHSSYLIDLEDGRALVIDPPRIPDAQLVHARAEGLDVAFTADTHTHADYVSGSPELAAQGVTFLAPTAAGLQTGHRGLRGGDEINFGRLTLRALDTPGHTPDHLAYLLLEAGQPVALFSGGSLMVGTVGRTDLLGDDYTEDLARAQHRSLHEQILTLPDDLAVYPTHGRGSFCSAPGATERTTTVGRERATNPLLQGADEDAFVRTLVASFGTLPSYFTRLPELNRRGPQLYGNLPTLARLTVDAVQRRLAEGAVIVDARPIDRYAAGHIRGAVSHALRPAFGTWLASTVSPDSPHVMILDADQDERELVRQALNVGHDNLAGLLDGGIDAWRTAELPMELEDLT